MTSQNKNCINKKEFINYFFKLKKEPDFLSVQLKTNPTLFNNSWAQFENIPIYFNFQQTKFTPIKSSDLG